MLASVDVLRAGYFRVGPAGAARAAGTVTLVSSSLRVLVDTGGPGDGPLIERALAERGLSPRDIDVVVCSHGHADHIGNNALFSQARFLIGPDLARGDEYRSVEYGAGPYMLDRDVSVIHTPGHTSEDLTVLVRTEGGVVAVVGDLFESEADLVDQTWVAFSRDPLEQARQRERVLALARFIVPGHGDRFEAPRARSSGAEPGMAESAIRLTRATIIGPGRPRGRSAGKGEAVDRSYIDRNRASRERLRALGERLTDEQLAHSLGDGWTVGVALAHLAYWDWRVLATIETSVRHGLPRYWWEGAETEGVNAARLACWQAILPRQALTEALRAADALDRVLEELPSDALAAIAEERPLALDRSRHRGAHLDDVERALGR